MPRSLFPDEDLPDASCINTDQEQACLCKQIKENLSQNLTGNIIYHQEVITNLSIAYIVPQTLEKGKWKLLFITNSPKQFWYHHTEGGEQYCN